MEYLDLVDSKNHLTGEKTLREIAHKEGLWHREIDVWVMNQKGELLLQKRASCRKVQPNKWSICAGHALAGENIEKAAKRELKEELGLCIALEDLELITIEKVEDILPNSIRNFNFRYIYFCKTDLAIDKYILQSEEVSQVKYISLNEFEHRMNFHDPEITFSSQPYIPKLITVFLKKANTTIKS